MFVDGAYQAQENWYNSKGKVFQPGLHYFVGGNSKVYGAALFRLRERDFDEIRHADGISPSWPLKYDAFEPFYAEAEQLFHVHGAAGEDPNEPMRSGGFPYPAVSHEPKIEELSARLRAGRAQPVPSAARHFAGREGWQADADRAPAFAAMPSMASLAC